MGKAEAKGLFKIIWFVIILILTIITIAAAFSGYLHPADSKLMSLLGMALPVLVLVNIIVLLITIYKRSIFWGLPLLALLMSWNFIGSMVQPRLRGELPQDTNGLLTVATYNVHGFGNEIRGYSCRQIAQYMSKEQADVLCFQEFRDNKEFTMEHIKETLAEWPYFYMPNKEEAKGKLPIAIFSRYPIADTQYITYPNSSNCSMMADVQVGDKTIRIINNHLQTTNITQKRKKWEKEFATDETNREVEAMEDAAETLHGNLVKRAEQTDILCRLIEESPYPIVLCGDLNSMPSSYTYRRFSSLLKDGFKTCGNGYMYTYRNGKHLFRIDYLFHSEALEGVRYFSPNMELCSDHNPVIMTVKTTK